jgi:hypothetical protein
MALRAKVSPVICAHALLQPQNQTGTDPDLALGRLGVFRKSDETICRLCNHNYLQSDDYMDISDKISIIYYSMVWNYKLERLGRGSNSQNGLWHNEKIACACPPDLLYNMIDAC